MELDIRPAWRNYWISLGLCGLFLISFVGSPATPDGTNWAAFAPLRKKRVIRKKNSFYDRWTDPKCRPYNALQRNTTQGKKWHTQMVTSG